ncbi:MAG: hypothetical protein L0154_21110 [Chloroflexi bacterium]|nr:hypothetical protein [Chloroflexota bacterium]
MRRVLMLVLLTVGLSVVLTDSASHRPALACTGPILAPLDTMLSESDFAFYGRIVDVDSLGGNAIVQVDSYLTENVGPEYAGIQQNVHRQVRGYQQNYYSCGIYGVQMRPGDTGIFFANRKPEGVMWVDYVWYTFSDEAATRKAYYLDENGEFSAGVQEYSQAELLSIVEQITQTAPLPPDTSQTEVLPAPILIRTDDNSAYMLPIDMQEPVLLAENVEDVQYDGNTLALFKADGIQVETLYTYEYSSSEFGDAYCITSECFQVAAEGFWTAYQQDSTTIALCYSIYSFCEGTYEIKGTGFNISQSGEFIATWDASAITIHDIGSMSASEKLVTFEYEGQIDASLWSDEGQLFAFTDANGLNIWNRRRALENPQLVVSKSVASNPYPISFSARNTYIGVHDGDERYTLDLLTGTQLPYGNVSPDEHHLAISYTGESDSAIHVCDLYVQCEEQGILYFGVSGSTWTSHNRLLVNGCVAGDDCGLLFYPHIYGPTEIFHETWRSYLSFHDNIPYDEVDVGFPWWEGTSLIYHPIRETIALINNPQTFSIAFGIDDPIHIFQDERYVTIDFSEHIDGDIVSIEWLPSYFYENTFRRYVR